MQCQIQFHDKDLLGLDWCKLDSTGEKIINSGTSKSTELATLCSECTKTIVFLPQQHIFLASPVLPAKASKQQLNAIAYSIEESVAEDIENCFFAILDQQVDNSVPVAVINRDLMDRVAELLSRNHINSRLILPQIYLCPWFNDDDLLATVCELDEGFLIRTGKHEGVFCHKAVVKQLLDLMEKTKSPVKNRVLMYTEEALIDLETSSLQVEQQAPVDLITQTINSQNCINLKQKEYESSHQWIGLVKQWQWPMAAMLLLAVAVISGSLINSWQKQKTYDEIINQQRQVLLQKMPDQPVTGDPKRQLIQLLAENQNSNDQAGFVDFLHEYSRLKTEFKAVETQRIQYQKSRLAVNLQTDDLKSMESFRNRLQQSSFQADIENVSISPDKTTGRLVMGAR